MRYLTLCLLFAALATFVALLPTAEPKSKDGNNPAPPVPGHRYPDFGFMPAPHLYEGRVFKLSQEYPSKIPDKAPTVCTVDFEGIKKGWKKYLTDLRAYCFEGNVLGGDVEDDWRVENNKINRWFHMPWQHYGPTGREGIHGLTKEAPVQVRQLDWSQTYSGGQTYAVGFYNDFGGYTIGQVWADHEHPAKGLKKIEFPIGTVVCKVLFVDVPSDQVLFLNPPLEWQGFITKNYQSAERSIRKLSLIQMDVMVRHQDAPSGWLFGTYQYNGALKEKNRWFNLVPVGLQWGNDPQVKADASNPQPVKTIINDKLKETVINPDAKELPATHLGWNGRLNGPVDNPMSSCMSCHMAAETPQRSPISPLFEKDPPPPGSDGWMRWFQNASCGERFDEDSLSTDFSLQMALALQNFRSWRNEGSKMLADRYKRSEKNVPARFKEQQAPAPLMREMHDAESAPEVEIRRDYPPQRNP
jgi:hypothetical protein